MAEVELEIAIETYNMYSRGPISQTHLMQLPHIHPIWPRPMLTCVQCNSYSLVFICSIIRGFRLTIKVVDNSI